MCRKTLTILALLGVAAVANGFCFRATVPVRSARHLKMVAGSMVKEAPQDELLPQAKCADFLVERWPVLKESPAFVAAAAAGARPGAAHDPAKVMQWAKTWSRMARTIILARGIDTIAEDFTYYSPSTGSLNKREFLSLMKTLDVAFSDHIVFPRAFFAMGDGVVAYTSMWRAVHDGPLKMGSEGTVRGSGLQALSDIELSTVSFTPTGKLLSHTTGMRIAATDAILDPDMVKEIGVLERKIAGQIDKLASLAGQEHTIAYTKTVEENTNMNTRLNILQAKCDIESNVGDMGGLHGLFHAIGVPFPKEVSSLFGSIPYDKVEGTRQYGYSVPSEVAEEELHRL